MSHESAIDIHMSPPSWSSNSPPTPSHPSSLSQSTKFEFPVSCSKFPLATLFAHVSILLFQFVLPSHSSTVSTNLFSMFASPLLSCKYVHQYHLSRFHTYALIYNICFSLSDLLTLYNRLMYPNVHWTTLQ